MALTYQELLKQLHRMSPANLKKPVQLRDYNNEETHEAIDFVPVMEAGSHSDGPQNFQIGFNDFE